MEQIFSGFVYLIIIIYKVLARGVGEAPRRVWSKVWSLACTSWLWIVHKLDLSSEFRWWSYASRRLGAFVLMYLVAIFFVAIGFALVGITVTFGLMIALIPLAVFIALRLSGALVRKQ